ncbi:transposable element Tc1 transposase [Trichonephila clavipes]|nr:transposable element Tc1 transposase [Trichonephila clavipes]
MGRSDADKNRWTAADFNAMIVDVDQGPQQIRRIDLLSDQLSQHLINRYQVSDLRLTRGNGSRFQLCPSDHRRRIWRRPGQRADSAFIIARHTGPQQGIMPDLSSMEHVWDMMGRRLHLLRNVDDLVQRLEQIWQEIPQETVKALEMDPS